MLFVEGATSNAALGTSAVRKTTFGVHTVPSVPYVVLRTSAKAALHVPVRLGEERDA